MRRNLLLAFSLFFSLLLFTGCDSGPKIGKLEPNDVVLSFGDSLTYGTGAPRAQSYPAVLEELLGNRVINVGIPGEVSAAGLKRLPSSLEEHKPALVILTHGGNDFLRRLDQDRTNNNVKQMVEMARSSGANVILVGVPKLGFGLEVPAFYAAIAEEQSIPYQGDILVDLIKDSSMKSDSIHPNATGYRLMAEAIHELIENSQQK